MNKAGWFVRLSTMHRLITYNDDTTENHRSIEFPERWEPSSAMELLRQNGHEFMTLCAETDTRYSSAIRTASFCSPAPASLQSPKLTCLKIIQTNTLIYPCQEIWMVLAKDPRCLHQAQGMEPRYLPCRCRVRNLSLSQAISLAHYLCL